MVAAHDFAADAVAVSPERALKAMIRMSSRRRCPPESVEDLLLVLRERYGMDEAVMMLEEVI